MENQYFKIIINDGNAFIHFYPPKEGGKRVAATEVMEYLETQRLGNTDLKSINDAINAEGETEIFLGSSNGLEVNESMSMKISLDKMKVTCRFYPPSKNGHKLSAQEIVDDLSFRKIRFGVSQEAIEAFLKERQYCTDYVLAEGMQPRHGRDAKIEYFFNTDMKIQPKRNEDGSVDYKELNTICHIQAGDLLARLIPEDKGDVGRNIFGEEIRPRTVKTAKLEFGKNITLSEDRTEIRSDVTGHVSFINGKVFVSNVFVVPADVDNSVGNIDYDGSVQINGNVKAGFSVKATGDIIIDGVVENAFIETPGQIIVKHGIHGMHKGVLRAGTNVMAKYIENATVYAGGYIEAEIILNSDVSCGGSVRIKGKKGLINGGTVRAVTSVEAENIGTEMGTFTRIEVGIDPERKKRYSELNKEVAKRSRELEKNKEIIANYSSLMKRGERLSQDKLMYVQKLAASYKLEQAELDPLREEIHRIHMEMLQSDHAFVSATKKVHPGVTICISDLEYHVQDVVNFSRFRKVDGEIRAVVM